MRTDVSPEMQAAVDQLDTAPGYLIQIDFPIPYRCSTRGDLTYDGHVWVSASVAVSGITFNDAANQRGSLKFFDADGSISSLICHHGVADRKISIFVFDATAIDYPVGIFVGAGNKITGDGHADITIEIASLTGRTVSLPRMFITPENGFHHVPVPGTKYLVGSATWIAETRR